MYARQSNDFNVCYVEELYILCKIMYIYLVCTCNKMLLLVKRIPGGRYIERKDCLIRAGGHVTFVYGNS